MNTDKCINILVSEFLSEQDVCKLSSETYHRTLNVFINWMVQNANIKNPTKADILRYKNNLVLSGKSVLTIDAYLKVLGLFFRWLEVKSYHTDITKGTHKCRRYYGYRKGYLTADQASILLKSLPLKTLINKRNAAIINLMIRTGLRCIEVSRLSINDITVNQTGYALKIQRKGHIEKDCLMGISAKVYDPIECYLYDRGELNNDDPLFLNHSANQKNKGLTSTAVGRIVMNELTKQGLKSKQITAHSLRHTAAALSIKNGVGLYEVSKMLGHTSIQTTQIYTSVIDAETLKINPACLSLDEVF